MWFLKFGTICDQRTTTLDTAPKSGAFEGTTISPAPQYTSKPYENS